MILQVVQDRESWNGRAGSGFATFGFYSVRKPYILSLRFVRVLRRALGLRVEVCGSEAQTSELSAIYLGLRV